MKRALALGAAAGLAALVGCKSEPRELAPTVPTPQIQPEQQSQPEQLQPSIIETQCNCRCTSDKGNDNCQGYLMGSDTRIEATADYILATSKRIYNTNDFLQYSFLYDIKNNAFTENIYLFKRDGRFITYSDTDTAGSSHDGLVDKIEIAYLWGNNEDSTLERKIDYDTNRTIFDEADNLLKEARRIFKEYNSYTIPGQVVSGN